MTILDGKYLVGCALGEGGFGITYIGWDLQLRARVAVKEFFPAGIVYRDNTQGSEVSVFSGSGEAYFSHDRERFLQEARMLARFDGNPGVVNVKNYFKENGTAYIVMEYLEGVNLAVLAEQNDGKLPFQQVLKLLELPMKALGGMHRQNTYHRDISPENLMVTGDGRVKLIDFGSSRTDAQDKSRFLKVRAGFSPLEMYADEDREGAYSDIYALCATIYKTVTGVTPPAAADRVRQDTLVAPIRAGAKDMTPAQEQALLKGLAVRPEDRFQRVEDLQDALSADARPSRRIPRVPRWALACAAAVVVAAAVGLFLLLRARPPRFELTEEMFSEAPILYDCYVEKSGYPCEIRAYISGNSVCFTKWEGDRRMPEDDWRRVPMDGATLGRILDALRDSDLPICELNLQNLRLETLKPLSKPWPNDLILNIDCCALPEDWSTLADMGDSLVSLHLNGEYDAGDLNWMSSLTGLYWLAIGGDGVDVESISKLDWLSGISIGSDSIEDLTPFTRMKNLTGLSVLGSGLRDLSPLANMPWLVDLEIPNNDVTDLSPLAGLKKLRHVDATGNRISDFSPIERDGIEIVGRNAQR